MPTMIMIAIRNSLFLRKVGAAWFFVVVHGIFFMRIILLCFELLDHKLSRQNQMIYLSLDRFISSVLLKERKERARRLKTAM